MLRRGGFSILPQYTPNKTAGFILNAGLFAQKRARNSRWIRADYKSAPAQWRFQKLRFPFHMLDNGGKL